MEQDQSKLKDLAEETRNKLLDPEFFVANLKSEGTDEERKERQREHDRTILLAAFDEAMALDASTRTNDPPR